MVTCSQEMSGSPPATGGVQPPPPPATQQPQQTSLMNNLTWSPPPASNDTSSVLDGGQSIVITTSPGIVGPLRGPAPPIRGLAQRPPPAVGPGAAEFAGFVRPLQLRPPFFVREIYKNGFLKRLPYNEKKSSALAKLMKSDRFWVVFSIHDDIHPFLELWNEPTEVASKPPVYIFPLVACQHISPSIVPADSEWSFVVNFDTVAIRFACNSREVMDDWVDVIRNKLGEMGILNPKGNLYSKVPVGPPITKPVIRDPTSPLPQPPPEQQPQPQPVVNLPINPETSMPFNNNSSVSGGQSNTTSLTRTKSVIETSSSSAGDTSQSFTTSIYLNQDVQSQQQQVVDSKPGASLIVNRKSSLPFNQQKTKVTSKSISLSKSMADVIISSAGKESAGGGGSKCLTVSNSSVVSSTSTGQQTQQQQQQQQMAAPRKSSVYLNQASPTRHVTVIPINNSEEAEENRDAGCRSDENDDMKVEFVEYENHTYGAIFDFEEKSPGSEWDKPKNGCAVRLSQHHRRDTSPRRGRERKKEEVPPPLPHRPVFRRLSERKQDLSEGKVNIHKKVRRKSRRSSSLGPLLDSAQLAGSEIGASTHSLESVESNPRQAVPKSDRALGAIPRRPLPPAPRQDEAGVSSLNQTHPLLGSPTRSVADLPPGVRPPPYHPLAASLALQPGQPGLVPGQGQPMVPAQGAFPPMVPLPGLTCQLSIPAGLSLPPVPAEERGRTIREQQVLRLRQELAHPAGVRLILRKKDVQSSLALVDMFGCVWVAGWKQRDYPVLYNAFHLGDQILSVSGVIIRNSGEFSKLVKFKSNDLHTEIIIRRFPFSQIYLLKLEIEGQSLGLINNNNSTEIKEVVPGSVAAAAGITAKVRSFDGQTAVPLVITELNGRPISLFSKDGECWEKLQAYSRESREISIILQPSDIISRIRKQLKSIRGYKDFILS